MVADRDERGQDRIGSLGVAGLTPAEPPPHVRGQVVRTNEALYLELLGECLLRFRLALTATWLDNGEADDILSAAIALLVEHDITDPTEGADSGRTGDTDA